MSIIACKIVLFLSTLIVNTDISLLNVTLILKQQKSVGEGGGGGGGRVESQVTVCTTKMAEIR